jgi:hypothetical protein
MRGKIDSSWSKVSVALRAGFAVLVAWPGFAVAAPVISSIEPAEILQGDTVLLTLRGKDLPQGSLVVEFYPQQIAVLSVLSSSGSEVVLQAKVSSLAPPGKYNLVLYNQLGEEAEAKELLTVGSTVTTPVFSTYDPRTFQSSSATIAIALSGAMITPDAVAQLRMDWTVGDQSCNGLESTFAYINSKTAVCTVAGRLPAGHMRGRVYLNQRPIYQIEIDVEGGGASILGHSPTELTAGPGDMVIRLLCADPAGINLGTLAVSLASGEVALIGRCRASDVSGAIEVEFERTPALGDYKLTVKEFDRIVYEGDLHVGEAPVEPKSTPLPPVPPDGTSPSVPPGQPVADEAQLGAQPPSAEADVVSTPVESQLPITEGAQTASQGGHIEADSTLSTRPQAGQSGASPDRYALEVEPLASLDAPLTIFIASPGDPEALSRLNVLITVDGEVAENVLSTVRGGRMLCLFAPPDGGWRKEQEALILVRDAGGQTFVEPLRLGEARSLALESGKQALPEGASGGVVVRLSSSGAAIIIGPEGISLSLTTPRGGPPAEAYGKVRVETDNLMLKANLSRLSPRVFPEGHDEDELRLLLTRDAETFPDDAWRLLSEMLRDAGELSLELGWPALGAALTVCAVPVLEETPVAH